MALLGTDLFLSFTNIFCGLALLFFPSPVAYKFPIPCKTVLSSLVCHSLMIPGTHFLNYSALSRSWDFTVQHLPNCLILSFSKAFLLGKRNTWALVWEMAMTFLTFLVSQSSFLLFIAWSLLQTIFLSYFQNSVYDFFPQKDSSPPPLFPSRRC